MPEESSSKGTDVGAGTSKEAGAAEKKTGGAGHQAKGFAPRAPKFEGKCTDLKCHIYDCLDVNQSDQYTKTTYKYSGDMRLAVETLKMPAFYPDSRSF